MILAGLLAGAFSGHAVMAQTFFGNVGDGVTVGVDRGSTVLLPDVDVATRFLTFDTYGVTEIGRDVASLSFALPEVLQPGDQFDALALVAGVGGSGRTELVAGGLGYRFALGDGGVSGFVNGDHADVVPGGSVNRQLDLRGTRSNLSLGLRRVWGLTETSRIEGTVELRAHQAKGTVLGTPALDEELRILRAALLYESGVPFGFRKRAALGLAKGLDGFGSSDSASFRGSVPGSQPQFLRVSLAAEASVPLSARWVVNGGVAGQWADVTLPLSERCGYGTNAYSRGFDQTFINGDRCLGSRVEAAYFLRLPSAANPAAPIVQGFGGLDFGTIWTLGNAVAAADHQTWSSVSLGVRALTATTVAEIAVSAILDDVTGIVAQDETRLWLRIATRF